MGNLLGYDGLLSRLARWIWRIFSLSCCFFFCSLPVFTLGAAASAVYAAFLNGHNSSGGLLNYFRDFKSNFKKATGLWLILLAIGLVLAGDWYALSVRAFPLQILLQILTVLATALYAITLTLVFPLQAHFENTVKQTLKNALILGLSMPLRTLLMAAIPCLPVALLLLDVDSFLKIIPVWLIFGPGSVAFIHSSILKKVFDKMAPSAQEQEEAPCPDI